MLGGVKADAGLLFVGALAGVGQGLGTRVFPQGLQGVLDLSETHVGAQGNVAVDVDFKGGVVAGHEFLAPGRGGASNENRTRTPSLE